MNRNKTITLLSLLFAAALIPSAAAARSTIGSYSYCKSEFKGKSAEENKCKKCLEGGNFYNKDPKTKKWVCGMTSDMKKSESAPVYKPPAKPKKMPDTASKYVTIPAGKFQIGARPDEEGADSWKEDFGQATITITRPFLMKTTEVTQGEWHFIMDKPSDLYDKACGEDCPANLITFRGALEYLNKLSEREKLEKCYDLSGELAVWIKGLDCKGYRLPTEAEWEYAARAGTTGPQYGALDQIAWYAENSENKLHPVGKKTPNAFGLYDMIGNVWEWAWDAYTNEKPFQGAMTDPIIGGLKLDRADGNRIVRGGNYSEGWVRVRVAHRFYYLADSGIGGFRPVRTVSK